MKHRLRPNPLRQRQLLRLLGSSPHGATEALLVRAYGFTSDMVADLVRAGLATAEREGMNAGAGLAGTVRLRLSAAGRKAMGE